MARAHWIAISCIIGLLLLTVWHGEWHVLQAVFDNQLVVVRRTLISGYRQMLLPAQPIFDWVASSERNHWLTAQLVQVHVQESEADRLRQENDYLRGLLQTDVIGAATRTIAAPVTGLGRPAVWVGAHAPVSEASLVFVNNVLLGKISEVMGATALVSLLSENSGWSVMAKTESGTLGVVSGEGGRVYLRQVPSSAKLQIGERVTTVGQLGVPPNTFIGIVAAVESLNAALPTQTVIIDQLVSFYQSPLVEVTQETDGKR